MPMALAAVSSSRTDMIDRPVLERMRLRMMTITQQQEEEGPEPGCVSFGMPIMPRPPFISGKGRIVSVFTIRVFTTMANPRVAMPK